MSHHSVRRYFPLPAAAEPRTAQVSSAEQQRLHRDEYRAMLIEYAHELISNPFFYSRTVPRAEEEIEHLRLQIAEGAGLPFGMLRQ